MIYFLNQQHCFTTLLIPFLSVQTESDLITREDLHNIFFGMKIYHPPYGFNGHTIYHLVKEYESNEEIHLMWREEKQIMKRLVYIVILCLNMNMKRKAKRIYKMLTLIILKVKGLWVIFFSLGFFFLLSFLHSQSEKTAKIF